MRESKHSIHKDRIIELAKENDYRYTVVADIINQESDSEKNQAGGALKSYCKKIISELSQIKTELNEKGVSSEDFRHGWIKTKNGSYFVKNDRIINYDEMREQFIRDVKQYAPEYPDIEYAEKESQNLLVVDIADLHLNKLTSSFETGRGQQGSTNF